MATCNVEALLESGKCFACLSKGQQEIIELQLLCEILGAGGGVGGGGAGSVGDYGGVEPGFTPTTEPYLAVDSVTEQFWWYYNGAWH